MTAALVSLLGAPGSGKTTVAHWLSAAMDAELLLEDYAGNPFLAASYAGADQLRLAGQSWFMLTRVDQLALVHWSGDRRAVSDYAYLQDRIYAEHWLSGVELDAYNRLAAQVTPLVRAPDVLVHLDGPVSLLNERIAGRGRDYEAFFTDAFVTHLRDACRDAAAAVAAPVVTIDVARYDLSQRENQDMLISQLTEVLSTMGASDGRL